MALTVNHPMLKETRIYGRISDSAAASTACYIPVPLRGKVVKVVVVGDAAVDSDRIITTAIGTGAGTAITGGAITMTASGSAAGSIFTATPTGANDVNEGDVISFITDGAGSTACGTTCVATIVAG